MLLPSHRRATFYSGLSRSRLAAIVGSSQHGEICPRGLLGAMMIY